MLAIDAVTARVVVALRDRGVRPVLLRGPAIGRLLYEADRGREYVDVDLLVSIDVFETAERGLTSLGFTHTALEQELRGDRPRYSHTWVNGTNGVMVDLHRSLTGVRAAPARVWDELSARTESLEVSNVTVDVPAPPAGTLVVVLNAIQHGLGDPRSLAELRRAIDVVPFSTWREAAALAGRLDAEEAFASGLRLTTEGARRAEELGLPARRSVATELKAQSAPEMSLTFDWVVREAGVRDGVRLVARKVVPSAAFMREWFPPARRSRLGLTAAYAWRPLWVLVHAVPALRAWVKARRAAQGPG